MQVKLIDDYIKKSPLYSPFKSIVLYRGVNSPKILFIGEAPGKEENERGIPFVGRSGKLLNSWIENFHLQNISGITNVVPLIPLSPSGSIRPPSLQEITYFQPFAKFMIEKYNPKLIVLLGATACKAILQEYIANVRFQVIEKNQYFITAHYHPAYFLRKGDNGMTDFTKLYEDVISPILDLPSFKKQDEKSEREEIEEIINK